MSEEETDVARASEPSFDSEEADVFRQGLIALNEAGIPYLLAGAFAKYSYTGIWRNTKDLDIFLKPEDLKPALEALEAVGFETEIVYKHWLAKAHRKPYFIDLIFGTGNGQLQVDESWFDRAETVEMLDLQVPLLPLAELITSKIYIAERYRFDGADVLHLILSAKGNVDWQRIVTLLGDNRLLLLWHLILFTFVYPGRSHYLPQDLMVRLFEEERRHWWHLTEPKAFRGTLIDPHSFVVDIEDWNYDDQRQLDPLVRRSGAVR